MKIGIDVQTTTGAKTGFGNYVLGLMRGFGHISSAPRFVGVHHPTKQAMRTWERFVWDQWQFPRLLRREKPDLIHKPCFSAPFLTRTPVLLTVPDIIPHLFPQNFSLTARAYWNGVLIHSIRRSRWIVSISEATKRDMVRHLSVSPDRIAVTPLAANDIFCVRERDEARRILRPLCLPERYFLCIGSLEPRKNLPFLITAFLTVAPSVAEDLVIVGKSCWGEEAIEQALARHALRHRVHFTGYVDDSMLPFLYNAATALLFPTLYEGFGLPALEAMQSGCPVLCSNTSSLPEVVGDAGVLLDPGDGAAWRLAMENISGDEQSRAKLSHRGLLRAGMFSWKRCAELTNEVYQRALRE